MISGGEKKIQGCRHFKLNIIHIERIQKAITHVKLLQHYLIELIEMSTENIHFQQRKTIFQTVQIVKSIKYNNK